MDKSENSGLKISYDKDADVLYVSIGPPKPAICETLDNGVVVRYNESTNKVIGFTIIDFAKRFSAKDEPVSVNLMAQLEPAA